MQYIDKIYSAIFESCKKQIQEAITFLNKICNHVFTIVIFLICTKVLIRQISLHSGDSFVVLYVTDMTGFYENFLVRFILYKFCKLNQ